MSFDGGNTYYVKRKLGELCPRCVPLIPSDTLCTIPHLLYPGRLIVGMESAPALWLSSVHGEARQGIRVGEGGHLQLAVPLSLTAPLKAAFSSELTPQVPVASIPPPSNTAAQR